MNADIRMPHGRETLLALRPGAAGGAVAVPTGDLAHPAAEPVRHLRDRQSPSGGRAPVRARPAWDAEARFFTVDATSRVEDASAPPTPVSGAGGQH